MWRQNRDVFRFLADPGSDAGKWCTWKEMARFLEDAAAILGLEGRRSLGPPNRGLNHPDARDRRRGFPRRVAATVRRRSPPRALARRPIVP